jgi:hypothetical protein
MEEGKVEGAVTDDQYAYELPSSVPDFYNNLDEETRTNWLAMITQALHEYDGTAQRGSRFERNKG